MFDGFQPFTITTQDDPKVNIYGIKSSEVSSNPSLPALLLLHGFPQSRHIWHRVAPKLTDKYNVVIMDIRGYGDSSKPAGIESYAKSAMARDCIAVMDGLGYTSPFFVCAHDRGARIAHKLCVDFPTRVRRAILLDICPTLAMYTKTDFDFARAYYHWFFLIQQAPLPETLISAAPRRYLELAMGNRQPESLGIFDPACFDYYVSVMEQPDAVHAMCNDYRASSTLDLDESRQDLSEGRKIKCPLLVLWGKYGVIEKCFDAVKEWQDVAENPSTVQGHSVESGHYIPEQAPDDTVSAILDFLR